MKKVSILIPTYNEEDNVIPLSERLVEILTTQLSRFDYEIVFIDNASADNTQVLLRQICKNNKKIKAIFNAKNFGQFNSPYYGLLQTSGDCTILMCADFQDPPELMVRFVEEWEKGYKIVIGQKTSSRESKLIYSLRTVYYKLIRKFSDVDQIEHFTGFGLYDKSFIDVLRDLKDPTPFLRGMVAEFGFKRTEIAYEQQKRRAGKTKNNFMSLYDAAMLSFTSYTKIGLRVATFFGIACGIFSFIIAVVYLVLKLIYWDRFAAGMAPVLIGMFLIASVQSVFIGLMGEYILSINTRTMNHPLVIEEERINFVGSDETEHDLNERK